MNGALLCGWAALAFALSIGAPTAIRLFVTGAENTEAEVDEVAKLVICVVTLIGAVVVILTA